MKKKVICLLFTILLLSVTLGCSSTKSNISEETNQRKEMPKTMTIIIENNEYVLHLENNESVKKLLTILPDELYMKELNGNEKYAYVNNNLPTHEYNPNLINKGDVMLYGNNCLVIFYKSFNTSYSYTKIGHIDNLPDLGKNDVKVEFKK